MKRHINISVIELLDKLKENHPDKMLIDDFDCFTRGKLAGHIEIIEEIEFILFNVEEEEDGE